MILGKMIQAIDSHTAGMPTRIVIGGIPELPGNDIMAKALYFKNHFDDLRTALFHEPRGLLRGTGAVLTSSTRPEAHVGVFFIDSASQMIPMCGHGSIGVITAAIEFGMVDAKEPVTDVVLDTPAGLVSGRARVSSGRVAEVAVRNVPAYLHTTANIDIPGLGPMAVEVAYGGNYFVIVAAEDLDCAVDLSNVQRLSGLGSQIKRAANEQLDIKHPDTPKSSIDAVRFCSHPGKDGKHIKNLVIFGEGDAGIDRSPCGTGTSAHMAALFAKGQIQLNEEVTHESIIGTTFSSRLVEKTRVGGFEAVVPEIQAAAHTTGIISFVLSPDDPIRHGFLIR
jgi:proline racemase/trans-L-3-hydroxyproline dehydratase